MQWDKDGGFAAVSVYRLAATYFEIVYVAAEYPVSKEIIGSKTYSLI
ncbi:hypothetical protein [Paenibacillus ihumii]|nr:hypothetical protein [Paenibacillus ihumii]